MSAAVSPVTFTFEKQLYSKTALFKAAYRFTDAYYIHLASDDHHFLVTLEAKNEAPLLTAQEFQNELLTQMVREAINEQTKELRLLLMARALSSSMIETSPDQEETAFTGIENTDLLEDWFAHDE